MMVFLHHMPTPKGIPHFGLLQQAGGFGVSVFFVLSAYLITELLLRERERSGTVHVGRFFLRRLLRIWPLYFAALGLGVLLGHFVHAWRFSASAALWFTFLLGNFWIAAHGWPTSGLTVLWSLSIEEQFYAGIPLLIRWGGRVALTCVGVLAILAAYPTLIYLGRHGRPTWENSLVNFQFFGAGTLLALALHQRTWKMGAGGRLCLLCVAAAAFCYAGHTLDHASSQPDTPFLLVERFACGLTGSVCLFLSFLNADLKKWRLFIRLGQMSYGLYVFHYLILFILFYPLIAAPRFRYAINYPVATSIMSFLITAGIAWLSFHYFEMPINRFKERFAVVKSGAAVANQTEERA